MELPSRVCLSTMVITSIKTRMPDFIGMEGSFKVCKSLRNSFVLQ